MLVPSFPSIHPTPGLLWVFSPSGSAQAFQAPKPPVRVRAVHRCRRTSTPPYIDAIIHPRAHDKTRSSQGGGGARRLGNRLICKM